METEGPEGAEGVEVEEDMMNSWKKDRAIGRIWAVRGRLNSRKAERVKEKNKKIIIKIIKFDEMEFG